MQQQINIIQHNKTKYQAITQPNSQQANLNK